LTSVVCSNVDATTAPLSAGPVQTHGATIRGLQSPLCEGPASAGTPRAGQSGRARLKIQISLRWVIGQHPEQFEENGSVGDGAGADGDRYTNMFAY
jgi:hypothetical protein